MILVGYAVLSTPIYNPRYLSFCTPALATLLGSGLVRLQPRSAELSWVRLLPPILIVTIALPIYASQRAVYAKSGADSSEVAEFVQTRRGPDQGVYFVPRPPLPRETAVVGITSRTAQTLHPDAFTRTRDLTLVSSAAADANLFGRSQLSAASTDRLDGLQTVFVIGRRDYPEGLVAEDTALLRSEGFQPSDHWEGPLIVATEFVR